MSLYAILSAIIVLAAVFSFINYRFLHLPSTIGLMILSLIASIILVIIGNISPALTGYAKQLIGSVDFASLLLNIMLSFILFAGAIHSDVGALKRERWHIILQATLGVMISTAVIGFLLYGVFQLLGQNIPILYCLLFGAMISPTDPVAVLGILKKTKLPASLKFTIAGESLFNDGVSIALFLSLTQLITGGIGNFAPWGIVKLVGREAIGGVLLGLALGYAGFLLLKHISNYKVEILITLAIVMGGYTLAGYLSVSGPIAMVIAGLITGSASKKHAMSETAQDYLGKFWEMMHEILNAILFILIGFELLVVKLNMAIFLIGLMAILITLIGRAVSVVVPLQILYAKFSVGRKSLKILIWGGIRGGISVALALSLSADMYRDIFVSVTYIIVLFSIIVQGLTLGKVAEKIT